MTSRSCSKTATTAKGIAIIAVVMGHLQLEAYDLSFWESFRTIAYSFHIATFFLVSGFLYGLNRQALQSIKDYTGLVARKMRRLALPYLTVTALIVLIKLWAARQTDLRHPVDGDLWQHILINPAGGPTTHLWFLYALLLVFFVHPLLVCLLRNSYVVLALAIGLSFLPLPSLFCLNMVAIYLPVFSLGYIFAIKGPNPDRLSARTVWSSFILVSSVHCLLFLISQQGHPTTQSSSLIATIALRLLPVTGGLTCFILASGLSRFHNARLLTRIGASSYAIYLLHTIPVGIIWILVRPCAESCRFALPAIAIATGVIGIVAPIVFETCLLNRSLLVRSLLFGKAAADNVATAPDAQDDGSAK